MKKAAVCLIGFLLGLNLCGCFALMAGAAGGAGTAVWLSGKLSQDVNASYDRTIDATRAALKSLDYPVTKETRKTDITQFKSTYTDGKEIWIDIRRISDKSSKIEVRVGAVEADKEAADKILTQITRRL